MADTPPVDDSTYDSVTANLSPAASTGNPQAPGPSTSDTATAFFRHETLIGAGAVKLGNLWNEYEAPDDPSFNPYQHVAQNEGDYQDVLGYIRKDGIGDVKSAAQLKARVAGWRRERADRETMARGTGAGMILGTGMSFADISTLVPVAGVVSKGGAVLRVAKMAAAGGGITAAQEAGLQEVQEDRSAKESYMNIGIGTALGGGLGVFGELVTPKTAERMDVANPEGQTEYTPGTGEGLSKATVTRPLTPEQASGEAPIPADQAIEGVSSRDAAPASVGAAALHAPQRLDMPQSHLGKAIRKAAVTIGSVNPNIRAMAMQNPVSRRILIKMSGTPVHTDSAAKALAATNVDQLKWAYASHLGEISDGFHKRLDALREELGQKGAAANYLRNQADRVAGGLAEMRGKERQASFANISQDDFTSAVRHRLLKYTENGLDDDFQAQLKHRYGDETASRIDAEAQAVAGLIHRNNKIFEDKMVDMGMIEDGQQLGDDYGMAILYDKKAIDAAPKQAASLFLEMLVNKPTNEFLNAHGFEDAAHFEQLGKQDVVIHDQDAEDGLRTISAAEGQATKDELLATWVGTEHDQRLTKLEAELEEARAWYFHRKRQAVEAYHQLRTDTSGRQKSDLNLAKEYAKQAIRKRERYSRLMQHVADERRYVSDRLTQLGSEGKERTRLAGRLDELDHQMQRAEGKLSRLDQQIKEASFDIERAEKAQAEFRAKAKEARDARREARRARDKLASESKRAARRLRKAENAKTLNQYVDELVSTLRAGHGEDSIMSPESLMGESGRTKDRKLPWTPEWRKRFEDAGLIRSDLFGVLSRQYEETTGAMALRTVFGNEAHGLSDSAFYKSLQESVRDSYDSLIEAAQAKGDEKTVQKWRKEKKTAESDLSNYIQYHLGRLGRGSDPDSMLIWLSGELRKFSLNKYGLGFGISSMADVGTMVLTIGRHLFSPTLLHAAWQATRGVKTHEANYVAVATEWYHLNHSATYGQANLDSAVGGKGIGPAGTLKNKITSRISRATDFSTQQVATASGMTAWNSIGKTVATMAKSRAIYDAVQDYDGIYARAGFREVRGKDGEMHWQHSDGEAARTIGDLSSLGIGRDEALKIAERIQKYDIKPDENGIVSFELHRWFDEDYGDADIAHTLLGALTTSANRGILTPGAGDRPFGMSKPLASLLLQFQSYGFIATSQFLTPLGQRITHYGDAEAYMAAMSALSAGLLVTMIKDGSPFDRDPKQLAYDAFDRAGFLGFMSPYASAAQQVVTGQAASRYSSVNMVGQFLGPSYSSLTDTATATGTVAASVQGDKSWQDVYEKTRRLMPYQQLFRLSDTVLPAQHD